MKYKLVVNQDYPREFLGAHESDTPFPAISVGDRLMSYHQPYGLADDKELEVKRVTHSISSGEEGDAHMTFVFCSVVLTPEAATEVMKRAYSQPFKIRRRAPQTTQHIGGFNAV